ncbi:thioesterase [Sphingorhabdus lutea]|uniref:Thioesterase n=1 Tax=Sphingorhabdus lutea TaxID=1913578 RepID=A0A1L3JE19_9SPHN|nr:YbgC/FadM family acyl-CoA thioesterase [Sphingorhabdus lutea]APG63356.1 thioesterase [Sphingorhabdus lutea]
MITSNQPYQGHFTEIDGVQTHIFALRVYFEDTDFSGVVYHARYLHFMERARSDMLARADIDQAAAFAQGLGAYAVSAMDMKFHAPAHFDDALVVQSCVEKVGGASVHISQQIFRNETLLLSAQVRAAFVAPGGRPARQPAHWIKKFNQIAA